MILPFFSVLFYFLASSKSYSNFTHDIPNTADQIAYWYKYPYSPYFYLSFLLETYYGIYFSGDSPSLRFLTYGTPSCDYETKCSPPKVAICNATLCGWQPRAWTLASKYNVHLIMRKLNLTDMAPKSYLLYSDDEIDEFEASFPCNGVNDKFIFKTGEPTAENGDSLSIPKNYSWIRANYLVPYEDWW